MSQRPWKPLSQKALRAILADTEKDCPEGVYCAADVYRLAREVEEHRKEARLRKKLGEREEPT